MTSVLAVPAALGAAGCYAAASALQHHEARRSSEGETVALGGIVRLLSRPLWLLGGIADLVGLVLQVVALDLGPVTLVQPLQVTGLLFALPLGATLSARRVSAADLAAAALVVAGLGLFLGLARIPSSSASLSPGVAAGLAAGTLAVLGVGFRAGRGLVSGSRAAVLGGLAGSGFATTAVLLAALAGDQSAVGWSGLLRMSELPLLVGLAVTGVVSVGLSQAAFQVGSLAAALPALTVVDPVVAVVLGAVFLDESIDVSPVSIAGYGVALALVTVGVVRLARSGETEGAPAAVATAAGGGATTLAGLLAEWRALAGGAGLGAAYGLAASVLPAALTKRLDPDAGEVRRILLAAGCVLLGAVAGMGHRARRSRHPATPRA